MPANKPSTNHPFDTGTYGDAAFNPDDDAPDLTTPEWAAKFAKARLQRGRPKAEVTKVSTTLRLDPEVLERFKSTGPGWQSRMNDALRRAAGLTP
jgi:uncharacterized protein (DUF4415 family)